MVGRYLTDSVGSNVTGYFPQLAAVAPHNHDGIGGMHMYMPWWKGDTKNDFPRGYHIEFGGDATCQVWVGLTGYAANMRAME